MLLGRFPVWPQSVRFRAPFQTTLGTTGVEGLDVLGIVGLSSKGFTMSFGLDLDDNKVPFINFPLWEPRFQPTSIGGFQGRWLQRVLGICGFDDQDLLRSFVSEDPGMTTETL